VFVVKVDIPLIGRPPSVNPKLGCDRCEVPFMPGAKSGVDREAEDLDRCECPNGGRAGAIIGDEGEACIVE